MNSHLACAMPYDTCVELKNLLGLGEKKSCSIEESLGRRNSFGELLDQNSKLFIKATCIV